MYFAYTSFLYLLGFTTAHICFTYGLKPQIKPNASCEIFFTVFYMDMKQKRMDFAPKTAGL